MSAAVVNIDGLTQANLRGDGAHAATFDPANDKAYTAITLGATHNEASMIDACAKAGIDKISAPLK